MNWLEATGVNLCEFRKNLFFRPSPPFGIQAAELTSSNNRSQFLPIFPPSTTKGLCYTTTTTSLSVCAACVHMTREDEYFGMAPATSDVKTAGASH